MHFRVIPEPALTLHRHWLQVMQGKVDNLDEQARKVEEGVDLRSRSQILGKTNIAGVLGF